MICVPSVVLRTKLFSKAAELFYVLQGISDGSSFSAFLTAFGGITIFTFLVIVILICISLGANEASIFTCLLAVCISSSEMSAHVSHSCIMHCLSLLSCESFFYMIVFRWACGLKIFSCLFLFF